MEEAVSREGAKAGASRGWLVTDTTNVLALYLEKPEEPARPFLALWRRECQAETGLDSLSLVGLRGERVTIKGAVPEGVARFLAAGGRGPAEATGPGEAELMAEALLEAQEGREAQRLRGGGLMAGVAVEGQWVFVSFVRLRDPPELLDSGDWFELNGARFVRRPRLKPKRATLALAGGNVEGLGGSPKPEPGSLSPQTLISSLPAFVEPLALLKVAEGTVRGRRPVAEVVEVGAAPDWLDLLPGRCGYVQTEAKLILFSVPSASEALRWVQAIRAAKAQDLALRLGPQRLFDAAAPAVLAALSRRDATALLQALTGAERPRPGQSSPVERLTVLLEAIKAAWKLFQFLEPTERQAMLLASHSQICDQLQGADFGPSLAPGLRQLAKYEKFLRKRGVEDETLRAALTQAKLALYELVLAELNAKIREELEVFLYTGEPSHGQHLQQLLNLIDEDSLLGNASTPQRVDPSTPQQLNSSTTQQLNPAPEASGPSLHDRLLGLVARHFSQPSLKIKLRAETLSDLLCSVHSTLLKHVLHSADFTFEQGVSLLESLTGFNNSLAVFLQENSELLKRAEGGALNPSAPPSFSGQLAEGPLPGTLERLESCTMQRVLGVLECWAGQAFVSGGGGISGLGRVLSGLDRLSSLPSNSHRLIAHRTFNTVLQFYIRSFFARLAAGSPPPAAADAAALSSAFAGVAEVEKTAQLSALRALAALTAVADLPSLLNAALRLDLFLGHRLSADLLLAAVERNLTVPVDVEEELVNVFQGWKTEPNRSQPPRSTKTVVNFDSVVGLRPLASLRRRRLRRLCRHPSTPQPLNTSPPSTAESDPQGLENLVKVFAAPGVSTPPQAALAAAAAAGGFVKWRLRLRRAGPETPLAGWEVAFSPPEAEKAKPVFVARLCETQRIRPLEELMLSLRHLGRVLVVLFPTRAERDLWLEAMRRGQREERGAEGLRGHSDEPMKADCWRGRAEFAKPEATSLVVGVRNWRDGADAPDLPPTLGQLNLQLREANRQKLQRSRRATIDFRDLSGDSGDEAPLPRSTCLGPDPEPLNPSTPQHLNSEEILRDLSSEPYIDLKPPPKVREPEPEISFDIN